MTDRPPLVIRGCDALVRPGEVRQGVDVIVAGGVIRDLRATGWPIPRGASVIEAAGLLAIPGLVNAHTHSPENPLRGIGDGLRLEPWLCLMLGTAGPYSAADHRACALAGSVEMLKAGITSVIDHLWMTPPSVEAAEGALGAYRDAGIRAAVAPLMDDHDFTEDLAGALGVDLADAALSRQVTLLPTVELLAQLRELMERWHGAERGRLRVLAGPGGIQWCTDELLTGLSSLAREHGTGFHTHLLETRLQADVCAHRFGTSGVRALASLGVLGPEVSLAHSVWVEPEDVALIAGSGAVPVHNPAANLRLKAGRAPIAALWDAGATVALGTDGSASSDNQNLWDAVKLAALLHRDAAASPVLSSDALDMATRGGAAALGERERLGVLEPGALADIALLDSRAEGLAGAQVMDASLALSDCGRAVRHVVVDGDIVVRDGQCVAVDEDDVRAELYEQAQRRRATGDEPPAIVRRAMEAMEAFLSPDGGCAPGPAQAEGSGGHLGPPEGSIS